MNVEDLQSIIESGEGKKVEFKSAKVIRNPDGKNRYKIAKETVALANRNGGYLVFGIDDESHELEQLNIITDKARETISSILSDKCSPPIDFDCYYFDEEFDGEDQVFVIEVDAKNQIPHAVVDNSGVDIRKREYRIRAGEDSRLVTDSELYSLFSGETGQRFEKGSVIHLPISNTTHNIKCPDPYPEGYLSFKTFLSEVSDEEWKQIVNGGDRESADSRIQRLISELFPFAALYSIPVDYWVYCVEDEYGAEDLSEIFSYFDEILISDIDYEPDDLLNDPDLIMSDIELDPFTIIDQHNLYGSLLVPKGIDLELTRIDKYNVSLEFEKGDLIKGGFTFSGSPAGPKQGIDESHPLSGLVEEDEILSYQLSTWIECEYGYPDVEDRHLRENKIFVESMYETLDQRWDWNRCITEEPSIDHRIEYKLEEIDRKVDYLLQDE